MFGKRVLFIVLGLFVIPFSASAAVIPDDPGNFITTWNTENDGTSNNDQITIPGNGGGYSYEIYWEEVGSSTNNGTTSLITSNSYTLTFPSSGIYEVQASGSIPRIYFNGGGDKDKILTVEQWGSIAWTNMQSAFRGTSNLRIPASDAPDLSGATSIRGIFESTKSIEESLDHWDVSTIDNMQNSFRSSTYNQPLNSWNVSNVTTMSGMFQFADFNQPLNGWMLSSLENMNFMFDRSSAFNQDISSWNTASVTTMTAAFRENTVFNQDIGGWNTSRVATFTRAFVGTTAFDQDLSAWNVASATSMLNLFQNASLSAANQDALLVAWAGQSLQNNVPFHIGLKRYSITGAAAIASLEGTYNWDVSEQYQADYFSSSDAVLVGDSSQSFVDATTTAVEIVPDKRCTFVQWDDGNTDIVRTDVLTDNLSVTAQLTCSSGSSGTSAETQVEKATEFGNIEHADEVTEKFLSTSTDSADTSATLEESLELVKVLPGSFSALDPETDQDTIKELIRILLELVEILGLLLLRVES